MDGTGLGVVGPGLGPVGEDGLVSGPFHAFDSLKSLRELAAEVASLRTAMVSAALLQRGVCTHCTFPFAKLTSFLAFNNAILLCAAGGAS